MLIRAPLKTDPLPPWRAEFAYRMRHLFFVKFVGTTAVVWVFFLGYFHLLRHVAYPVTVMPLTPLDAVIPVVPVALLPYLSLWFYLGIAPGLQRDLRALLAYGAWAGLLCIVGLALFYRLPTRIPTFVFDPGGMPGFDLLRGIDATGNACPSMHVAVAVFTAFWIDVLVREMGAPWALRAVNVAWCAAIALSTVAIRQHVVVDALAGAALGAAVAVPSLLWRPRHRDARRERQDDDRRAAAAMIAETPFPDGASLGNTAVRDSGRAA